MHTDLRAQGAADGAQQAARGDQERLASANGAAVCALGRDPAGAREREEYDHEEDDRGNAERDVELGGQVVLASRFFVHGLLRFGPCGSSKAGQSSRIRLSRRPLRTELALPRSADPDRATTRKLWPKANAQLGARSQHGIARRRVSFGQRPTRSGALGMAPPSYSSAPRKRSPSSSSVSVCRINATAD